MPKRGRAIDIARESARLIGAGTPEKEIVAAISQAFPGLSSTGIERARVVDLDQIDLWKPAPSGAQAEEIAAAVSRTRTKHDAETLFPKPDKANS